MLRRRTTEKRIFEPDAADAAESAPGAAVSPLNELVAEERSQDVRRALSQLPEKYRVPLVLAYYNEMSYDEIGAALGLARNNVATLLFRAKQQLRQKLKKEK